MNEDERELFLINSEELQDLDPANFSLYHNDITTHTIIFTDTIPIIVEPEPTPSPCPSLVPEMEAPEEALDETDRKLVCKICMTNQVRTVFEPCYHVMCCIPCSIAAFPGRCGVCRTPISRVHKVYFP